jgi:hypothetical protein
MIWSARNTDDPWVIIATNRAGKPGVELTLGTASVERAHERFVAGEEPPLRPVKNATAGSPRKSVTTLDLRS